MVDDTRLADGVVDIMKTYWNLPTDCNDGELIGFAEALIHRIRNGDSREAVQSYLAEVQENDLEMDPSLASRIIADQAIAFVTSAS
jgi:hypothetical protein